MCELKVKNWDLCVRACDEALGVDPGNIKALYRRAKARILAPTSGATELELALKDLERGHAEARRRGERKLERVVGRELKSLKVDLARQRKNDKKTFAGLFDRGSLYDGMKEEGGAGKVEQTKASVQRDLEVAKQMVQKYTAQGKDGEAKKLQRKIDTFEQELQMRREKAMREQFDFENPTKEMVTEAKAKGIDLTDPAIVGYLKALRDEKVKGEKGGSVAAAAERLESDFSARERRERYGEVGREERERNTGFFGQNR